ncbi:MAG TPA: methylated-DNA--[protein]-cysteine S-methyltransferase [Fimbriimonas sp.]|nr:methylated-DNA--[protein]-cysteine S-methyltransferase [Fimbriimonas sp.]
MAGNTVDSPIGIISVGVSEGAITWLTLGEDRPCSTCVTSLDAQVMEQALSEISAYFEGTLKEFTVPLGARGTEFQHRVWSELVQIPYGSTTSYGALAKKLGDANLTRAVGSANGSNPIALIVPCHRVIGSNGHLTGFAGGIERKKWLLDFESSENLFR